MTDKFDLWKEAGAQRPSSYEEQDRAFKAIEDELNRLREEIAKK